MNLWNICDQTSLYATQNERVFATNPEEIRAFWGISYIMSISKLSNVKCHWSFVSYFSNDGVRNAMTRNRFTNILQIYTLLITEQLIKHMTKFKGRVSSKHYMKSKPIKCVSSGGVNVAAKHDISMSFIFILAKMKKQSLNLGKQLLWICLKN